MNESKKTVTVNLTFDECAALSDALCTLESVNETLSDVEASAGSKIDAAAELAHRAEDDSTYETTLEDRQLIWRCLDVAGAVAIDANSDEVPAGMFYLGRRLLETAMRMVITERYEEFGDDTIENIEELLSAFAGSARLAQFTREHDATQRREYPLI